MLLLSTLRHIIWFRMKTEKWKEKIMKLIIFLFFWKFLFFSLISIKLGFKSKLNLLPSRDLNQGETSEKVQYKKCTGPHKILKYSTTLLFLIMGDTNFGFWIRKKDQFFVRIRKFFYSSQRKAWPPLSYKISLNLLNNL